MTSPVTAHENTKLTGERFSGQGLLQEGVTCIREMDEPGSFLSLGARTGLMAARANIDRRETNELA